MPTSSSQRGRLSRQKVAAAALALIDEEGIGAASMRSIAKRLGVEAMAEGRKDQTKGSLKNVGEDVKDAFEK